MENLRAYPHLFGRLSVIADTLFAVNSTLYKNSYNKSQLASTNAKSDESDSYFNTIIMVVGAVIVIAFIYNIYSVKKQKTAANQRTRGTYEREKPEPR